MQNLEPLLEPVKIADLRPTQMTVGLREVARKQAEWKIHARRDGGHYLGQHMIPVVIGPKSRFYLIDHHHLVRALMDSDVPHVLVQVIARLDDLSKDAFWTFLEKRGWTHPYDAEGRRHPCSALPKSIARLVDDPYRSLAGDVRLRGGYAKVDVPFFEFMWADYFRSHMPLNLLNDNYDLCIKEGVDLARKKKANFLPGWCGPGT